MIHVLTAHHRSPQWIDVQVGYLRAHLSAPFTTYASLEGVPERYHDRFDHVVPSAGRHAGKLNHLARVASQHARHDDLLLFLDGDAFPIADPVPLIETALADHALVAVRRDENLGDVQPHPCFCATTVGTWTSLGGDWSNGWAWRNRRGDEVSDVGGNLHWQLQEAGLTWQPLLRTSGHSLHPVWFGVYGGIVYHHGAGFRRMISRLDKEVLGIEPDPRLARRVAQELRLRRQARRVDRLSRDLFAALSVDHGFHHRLG
jgi:hypothetical protein